MELLQINICDCNNFLVKFEKNHIGNWIDQMFNDFIMKRRNSSFSNCILMIIYCMFSSFSGIRSIFI